MTPPHQRIAYLEGPGDIVAAFEAWRTGVRFQSETSVTFSSQFFDFAKSIGADTFCSSYCLRSDSALSPGFQVCNSPRPDVGHWHVNRVFNIYFVIKLAAQFWRQRRRVVYVAWGPEDLIFLCIFRLFGLSVVSILHNALWPHGKRPAGVRSSLRLIKQRWALRGFVSHVMVVSPVIAEQVRELAPTLAARISVFAPKFYPQDFDFSVTAPQQRDPPRKLLFVGRLEKDKGVFFALDALSLLEERCPGLFHLTYCGSGSASESLERRVIESALPQAVTLRGRLDKTELIAAYRACDIVLVPTTSGFAEGFGMVVAEAILCGKPVVCTSVVPSAQPCAAAALIVAPDDANAIADAVLLLATDSALYRGKLDGCIALRANLLDSDASFGAKLGNVAI